MFNFYSSVSDSHYYMKGFIANRRTVLTRVANHLFETREAEKLPTDKAEFYHKYLSKRVRPDIMLAVIP